MAALVLAQAAVLGVVINSGWYYNDDFALLMNASDRSLGWNYLKMAINDHLLPGLRLEFWLLRHTAPLEFSLTVAARIAMQAAATALLVLILTTLVGRRRRVLVISALYAFCPLILTNALWLTVALAVLPAQACVLGAIYAYVRATITGRLRWAAISGALLLAAATFWEKAAVAALILPVLSLGYLHEGSLLARLVANLREWRIWLLVASPIAAFTGYFIAAGYGGATHSVKVSDLADVLWLQWSRVVSPSLFGGPWRWFLQPGVSLGFADARTVEAVVVQVAVLAVVAAGVRLLGIRSLIAWALPVIPLVVGTALVAAGRFAFFGELIATTLRYGADLAAPFFMGVTLALTPSSVPAIRARWSPAIADPTPEPCAEPEPEPERQRTARIARPAVAAVLASAWLVGALLSVARFDRHWGANPAHSYVTTLGRSIDDAGGSLNMYDSTVSQDVLPIFFGPRWHMRDFLPLMDRYPTLDGPATEPLLADDRGRLVPAAFIPATVRTPPAGGLCAYLIQGAGTWRIPFAKPAPEGDGFLRIDYLQQRPSTAQVRVEDKDGKLHDVIPPSRVTFAYRLSNVTLRLPITSVAAVVMTTGAPDTHLCIGRLTVGAPFVAGSAK